MAETKMSHPKSKPARVVTGTILALTMLVAGCGQQTASKVPTQSVTASDVQRVISHSYNATTHTVDITVRREGAMSGHGIVSKTGTGSVEDLINTNDPAAVSNYATATYPTEIVQTVRIHYLPSQAFGPHHAGGTVPANATPGTPTMAPAPSRHMTAAVPSRHMTTAAPIVQTVQTREAKPTIRTIAASNQQYVVTNHGWVSYHTEPRLKSAVVGRLQLGDKAPLVRKTNNWWYEIRWNNRNVYITTNSKYTHLVAGGAASTPNPPPATAPTATKTVKVPPSISQPVPATPPQASGSSNISLPPPGVHWDTSITPAAGRNASVAAKTSAVLSVARSKLGTKYIWGHNEDRGQYGFDCSNYTEYVYHHALGYKFTTASRGQYRYVGVTVPASQMRPGDLLIFNKGGHVGIYAGNNQMIEEGGGLGKCGYLSVASNSYWGKHLTVVRRMY